MPRPQLPVVALETGCRSPFPHFAPPYARIPHTSTPCAPLAPRIPRATRALASEQGTAVAAGRTGAAGPAPLVRPSPRTPLARYARSARVSDRGLGRAGRIVRRPADPLRRPVRYESAREARVTGPARVQREKA